MPHREIQVAVSAVDIAPFPGTVHSLTSRGALAVFELDLCPELQRGQDLDLRFSRRSSDDVLLAQGQLVTARERPPQRCYAFHFHQELPEVEDFLSPGLRQERREVRRLIAESTPINLIVPSEIVACLPSVPELALPHPAGLAVPGQGVDIHHRGVRVRIPRGAELAFVGSERVLAELALEPGTEPLLLPARIRHRQESPNHLDFGLRFDVEPGADGEARLIELRERLRLRGLPEVPTTGPDQDSD